MIRDSGYVLDVPAGSLESEPFESLFDQAESVLASDPDRVAILSRSTESTKQAPSHVT